jgi:hypothetical protein
MPQWFPVLISHPIFLGHIFNIIPYIKGSISSFYGLEKNGLSLASAVCRDGAWLLVSTEMSATDIVGTARSLLLSSREGLNLLPRATEILPSVQCANMFRPVIAALT